MMTPWYERLNTAQCGEAFARTALRVATREGAELPVHLDLLAAVCQEAAVLPGIESEALAGGTAGTPGAAAAIRAAASPGSSSAARLEAALSVATCNHSTASVSVFLGQVYRLSGQLGPSADRDAASAWAALSFADKCWAVALADQLHSPRVLAALDGIATQDSDLRLTDAFPRQLAAAHRACLAHARQELAKGGAAAAQVLELLPRLSEATAVALLAHMATAAEARAQQQRVRADQQSARAAAAEAELAGHRSRNVNEPPVVTVVGAIVGVLAIIALVVALFVMAAQTGSQVHEAKKRATAAETRAASAEERMSMMFAGMCRERAQR
ncbi:hypothetical protein ABPG75_004679 [Micractinium tetrahymenae]